MAFLLFKGSVDDHWNVKFIYAGRETKQFSYYSCLPEEHIGKGQEIIDTKILLPAFKIERKAHLPMKRLLWKHLALQ
jgi:predicted secreted Zn-dependent protease